MLDSSPLPSCFPFHSSLKVNKQAKEEELMRKRSKNWTVQGDEIAYAVSPLPPLPLLLYYLSTITRNGSSAHVNQISNNVDSNRQKKEGAHAEAIEELCDERDENELADTVGGEYYTIEWRTSIHWQPVLLHSQEDDL